MVDFRWLDRIGEQQKMNTGWTKGKPPPKTLVLLTDGAFITVGYFSEPEHAYLSPVNTEELWMEPTHWHPLPELPKDGDS
jgi:hypothetical protein